MSNLRAVTDYGQSLWLNYLRRALIESGELRQMLNEGICGVKNTPSVVEKAITCSSDYNSLIERLTSEGKQGAALYEALLIDDAQRTADILHPIFSETEESDGFVTLPLNPELAHNAVSLIAEGKRLGGTCSVVNRSNIMLEVPATPAGIVALRALIADGCNVCVTHIFSLATYEQVVETYLLGMTDFLDTHSVWRLTPASVASVMLAAVDRDVDEALEQLGRLDLQAKAGVALAKLLYARSRELYGGERWQRLAQKGAKEQRLLWIDTVPRRFDLPDTYYADALIGPNTVHALAPATLHAFRRHGSVAETLTQDLTRAQEHMQALKELGIDIEATAQKPQERTLFEDAKTFQLLLSGVGQKRTTLEEGWRRLTITAGEHEAAVEHGLTMLCDEHVMCRIWEEDSSLWNHSDGPPGQFAWLHVLDTMEVNVNRLQRAVQAARTAGFNQAVIFAAGGAARVARLFSDTFGQLPYIPGVVPYTPGAHLPATVLESDGPRFPWEKLAEFDPNDTLFVLSDKSVTGEMLPVFYELSPWVTGVVGKENAGDHFVAITEPKSPLAQRAQEFRFRDCFIDHPGIHDGFAALSYSGLLPAALTGADLKQLLRRAAQMACNASGCNCPLRGDNVAAQLGNALGVLAQRGHHLTFISSPFLESFGSWAEALVAERLAGDGIQVASGDPILATEEYGRDRLFIFTHMERDETHQEAERALRDAGHPVASLHLADPYDIGGLLFTWQMAVTVAAYHLRRAPSAVVRHLATA